MFVCGDDMYYLNALSLAFSLCIVLLFWRKKQT